MKTNKRWSLDRFSFFCKFYHILSHHTIVRIDPIISYDSLSKSMYKFISLNFSYFRFRPQPFRFQFLAKKRGAVGLR